MTGAGVRNRTKSCHWGQMVPLEAIMHENGAGEGTEESIITKSCHWGEVLVLRVATTGDGQQQESKL